MEITRRRGAGGRYPEPQTLTLNCSRLPYPAFGGLEGWLSDWGVSFFCFGRGGVVGAGGRPFIGFAFVAFSASSWGGKDAGDA